MVSGCCSQSNHYCSLRHPSTAHNRPPPLHFLVVAEGARANNAQLQFPPPRVIDPDPPAAAVHTQPRKHQQQGATRRTTSRASREHACLLPAECALSLAPSCSQLHVSAHTHQHYWPLTDLLLLSTLCGSLMHRAAGQFLPTHLYRMPYPRVIR